jgi:predicted aspartyl protease
MGLTYKYKRVKRAKNIEIKTPSIPVSLSGKGGRYGFIALLDSGADISVISQEVAELLGLDLSGEREEATGIGGKVPAVQTSVNIEIGKPHEIYNFSIPVKVILDRGVVEDLPILLGRVGFFDKFVITFNQREEKVIIKKNVNNFR